MTDPTRLQFQVDFCCFRPQIPFLISPHQLESQLLSLGVPCVLLYHPPCSRGDGEPPEATAEHGGFNPASQLHGAVIQEADHGK